MSSSIYICYFGLNEPLVQTQVLPYVRELVNGGHKMALLTFEPEMSTRWTTDEIAAMREKLKADGIDWHLLPYHKRPSAIATAYDILNGVRYLRKLMRRDRFDILHGRVHVATLMGSIARLGRKDRPKLVFDIRGFFPEEYTDAGIWPAGGWLYRAAKRIERQLLDTADGFVVLTEKARQILFPKSKENGRDRHSRPVEVIPCCVDISRFAINRDESRTAMREELGIDGRRVIVYVGSFGGWYLSDELFEFFAAAREIDPAVFVMILTQRDEQKASDELRSRGFTDRDLFVGNVSPADVPSYLSAADLAVSFIKPCYSKQASSPTKNAEYLAAGLPLIANAGIGDVDLLIENDGVGVLLDRFDRDAYFEAIRRIGELGDITDHCRRVARERFDLATVGGPRYRRLYERLLS